MLKSPDVLLLSADATETAEIQRILSDHVNLVPACDLSELPSLLEKNDYDALFCAWSFQKGTWMDVLADVRECHPDLPVIVLSPAPEVREWAAVLEAGAFDLLVPPHDERSMLAVLEQASATHYALESNGLNGRMKLRV